MPSLQSIAEAPGYPRLKSRSVAGAVAGNITVTGIKKGDKLVLVQPVGVAAAELTAEFTITADNTINNTGGTSSAAQFVLVLWTPRTTQMGYADV